MDKPKEPQNNGLPTGYNSWYGTYPAPTLTVEPDYPTLEQAMANSFHVKPSLSGDVTGDTPKTGLKYDSGKIDWMLVPWDSLRLITEVLMLGAEKYAPDNWQRVEPWRYKKALLRHVIAYCEGEKLDPETGKSHLAHAGCNILFLLWFWLRGRDDE